MSATIPKYLEIAHAIEAKFLRENGSGDRLPTVRGIAEEHHVSIVTASRALQVLRDKGVIHTVERSGNFLASKATPIVESWALIQNLTPGPWRQATISMTQVPFERFAERDGFRLFTDFPIGDRFWTNDELAKLLRTAIIANVAGVVLLPSRVSEESANLDERVIELCKKEGLPVVLIERNLRGDLRPLTLDLVAGDDFDGSQLLTRHLLDQGRKRIAFVTGSPTSTHNNRLAGYLFTMSRIADAKPLIIYEPGGMPTKRAYREVAEQLMSEKIEGVVCYQDYTAVGVIMELMSRRVRVPQEMAVVGFDNLPIGDSFAVGVTTYSLPAERIAREAIARLRHRVLHPDASPIRIVVPGEMIIRESSELRIDME